LWNIRITAWGLGMTADGDSVRISSESFSLVLEELARLMPSDAHKLMPDGSVKDVQLSELAVGDKVLVKPGENFPPTAPS
jgi:cation transport ATPase